MSDTLPKKRKKKKSGVEWGEDGKPLLTAVMHIRTSPDKISALKAEAEFQRRKWTELARLYVNECLERSVKGNGRARK